MNSRQLCCANRGSSIFAQDVTQPNSKERAAGERQLLHQRALTRLSCYLLLALCALQIGIFYEYSSWVLALCFLGFYCGVLGERYFCAGQCWMLSLLAVATCLLLLGGFSAKHSFVSPAQRVAAASLLETKKVGRFHRVCLRVRGQESSGGYGAALNLRTEVSSAKRDVLALLQVPLHLLDYRIPSAGSVLCGQVKLRPVFPKEALGSLRALKSSQAVPGIQSYRGRLSRQGYVLQGKLHKLESPTVLKYAKDHSPLSLVQRFPEFHTASLLYAISLGRKDMVSKPVWRLFQHLGVSHLLVVSGFHLGVLCLLVRFLLRHTFLRFSRLMTFGKVDRFATVFSLLAAWGYYFLLPTAVPVLRAVLASSALLLVLRGTRRLYPGRSLVAVAIAVLLLQPAALVDVGPQLTFSALLGLWLGRSIDLAARKQGTGQASLIKTALLMSIAASMCTLPLITWYFDLLVPLAPLLSAVLSPVFSVCCIALGGSLLLLDYITPLPELVWWWFLSVQEVGLRLLFALEQLIAACGLGPREFTEESTLEKLKSIFGYSVCYLVLLALVARFPTYTAHDLNCGLRPTIEK